ncbi:MAG: hypothetical protein SVT56_12715, partial [Chloroflexota bacterium]|nr:hypothetical protein [Chloroflexota bacterium]
QAITPLPLGLPLSHVGAHLQVARQTPPADYSRHLIMHTPRPRNFAATPERSRASKRGQHESRADLTPLPEPPNPIDKTNPFYDNH